ncbi:unnamed protein product [Didymodactylos carnosus]|uniref:Uncharacterized protein n=1 Tax=Didymodactylos carnosus TaxID=1234261 RepID=A0A813NVP2_9BILA|nr:unnamed protein product [Didymodactylos carnosus]CAF0765566.1 unnamed protein product [Didymodactylos carnosus]CAF3523965.1 unnamed protein product [Didymodactylos carnosus]CAF3545636.1 unnamed protein product [Didymodactylos carnosus]
MATFVSNDVDIPPLNNNDNIKIVDVDDRFLDMSQHLYYQYHSVSHIIPSTISRSRGTLSSFNGGSSYTRKNKLRARLHHLVNGNNGVYKNPKRSLTVASGSNLSVPAPSLTTKIYLKQQNYNKNNNTNQKVTSANVDLTSSLVVEQTPINSKQFDQVQPVHLISTFQLSTVHYQHQNQHQIENSNNGDRESESDQTDDEQEVTITRL